MAKNASRRNTTCFLRNHPLHPEDNARYHQRVMLNSCRAGAASSVSSKTVSTYFKRSARRTPTGFSPDFVRKPSPAEQLGLKWSG